MGKIMRFIYCIAGLSIFLSLIFITKSAECKMGGGSIGKGIQKSDENKNNAMIGTAKVYMEVIATALYHYKLDNGMCPTTEQGLKALVKKPTVAPFPSNWRGIYIGRIPIDPWGRSYNYVCPGVHNNDSYDLSSYGADGVESQDDIINWKNSK